MKRIGNLYNKIISIENLILADKKARKGKKNKIDIILFSKNKDKYLEELVKHVKKIS